ncbi:MAG: hypothetical protein U0575_09100 [Phycisphaerales bacterium]
MRLATCVVWLMLSGSYSLRESMMKLYSAGSPLPPSNAAIMPLRLSMSAWTVAATAVLGMVVMAATRAARVAPITPGAKRVARPGDSRARLRMDEVLARLAWLVWLVCMACMD